MELMSLSEVRQSRGNDSGLPMQLAITALKPERVKERKIDDVEDAIAHYGHMLLWTARRKNVQRMTTRS